jgi:DNA-binding PadR family transcriptional regulator
MRRSDLGEFEEIVLLAVAALAPTAYSVVIAEELEQETGKTVTTGAVHAALQRLENKGLVSSRMGEATNERGGRRKRIFRVTDAGSRILHEVRDVRNNLWSRIAPRTLPGIRIPSNNLPVGWTGWWNDSVNRTCWKK